MKVADAGERLFVRLHEDATQGPESEAPAGALHALPVDAALRGHLAHVLAYREQIAPGRELVERVLPDGHARLVLHLGGDAAPAALLIGAHAAPALVRLRGAMDGLSVTLQPGATQALFGLPAGEIQGQAVPLEVLWQHELPPLLEALAQARDDGARLRALRAVLLRRVRRAAASASSALVAHAAALLHDAEGVRSVRDVAAAVGVGERRLQQLFHLHVGLSPRTFARLARLHAMLRALRQRRARPAWAALAADGGYYDQAHLANEFRALCGLSPGDFVRRAVSPSSKTAA